jgi:hypothetical protein
MEESATPADRIPERMRAKRMGNLIWMLWASV